MPRILALVGDYYHCSDQLYSLVSSLPLFDDATLTTIRYPEQPDSSELAQYDLVILAMMGQLRPRESEEYWIDEAAQRALADHVGDGAGLLVFHAGTASHPESGALRELTGGRFIHHPPEHPTVTISVVGSHPITEGVSTFAHPDEHYFMEVDDGVTPLLLAHSSLGEQSAGWCRSHGQGRVAVVVPGHTREMLEDPMLRRLVSNAVGWCLGRSRLV